jgi:hypothetical protein
MNVNPININALRREVPLVNVLNYAYTFNSFAKDIIGDFTVQSDAYTATGNPLQALLALTLNPHTSTDFGDNTQVVGGTSNAHLDILRAFSSGVGLNTSMDGHDRFALDQVFGKALFADITDGLTGQDMSYRNAMSRRHIEDARGDKPTDNLSFIEQGSNRARKIVQAPIGLNNEYLRELGGLRFDTTFIRNIVFISTAHRLMRAKMTEELMKNTYPVATGTAIVSRKNTDALPWETWEELRTD